MPRAYRALIVEDEPLLMAELRELLAELWPQLVIVGAATNGVEALRLLDAEALDVLFLDIELPGASGLDVARHASGRCHVVFVTAFDRFAVTAFEQGAVDYVLKPLTAARLATAVRRVRDRLDSPAPHLAPLLDELRARVGHRYVRWISAPDGSDLRFIAVDEICYLKSDNKYTLVVTAAAESLVRRPIRELMDELDPEVFWQIHRGTLVNVNAIAGVRRDLTGKLRLRLKQRRETLAISAPYVHRFR